jgi:hypothetical protein
MARKFDRLYPQVVSFENLLLAYRKAARGKRGHPVVMDFELNREKYLFALQRRLIEKTYRPAGYYSFRIHDPMVYYPGDDLLAVNRPRGLPIGNLTSQIWANIYLNELDQFVKRTLGCRCYLRYVDDFLLFAEEKSVLWKWKREISTFLIHLRLSLHERSSTVYPVNTGIPFLGFRLFPYRRRLKTRNARMFEKRLRRHQRAFRRGELTFEELNIRVRGWVAVNEIMA